jgi:hypothetical protein
VDGRVVVETDDLLWCTECVILSEDLVDARGAAGIRAGEGSSGARVYSMHDCPEGGPSQHGVPGVARNLRPCGCVVQLVP